MGLLCIYILADVFIERYDDGAFGPKHDRDLRPDLFRSRGPQLPPRSLRVNSWLWAFDWLYYLSSRVALISN